MVFGARPKSIFSLGRPERDLPTVEEGRAEDGRKIPPTLGRDVLLLGILPADSAEAGEAPEALSEFKILINPEDE